MSELTYEKNPTGILETYEWDNTWWHKNNDKEHPRIMTVGDSISVGTREAWNKIEDAEWYIDNCATSKGIDNPHLLNLVLSFYSQTVSCDAVLINNGLHGWHLSTEQYKMHYKSLLLRLMEVIDKAPIILMTTTCVTDAARNSVVEERNSAVLEIAEELSLPVIDLYTLSLGLVHTDGVHLDSKGLSEICSKIRDELKHLLNRS